MQGWDLASTGIREARSLYKEKALSRNLDGDQKSRVEETGRKFEGPNKGDGREASRET